MNDSSLMNVPGEHHILETERALWAKFIEAGSTNSFCQSWLAIQCRMINGVIGGLVLMSSPENSIYTPVAVWPDVRHKMEHLSATAEQALTERRGVLTKHETPGAEQLARYHIAYPVEFDDQLLGVVVLEVSSRPENELQKALRHLHWGIGWLIDYFRQQQAKEKQHVNHRLMSVIDMVSVCLDRGSFQEACTALVTELAKNLQCDRVSIGFIKDNKIKLFALSFTAQYKDKSNLIRDIEASMDEALEQGENIVFPELVQAKGLKVTWATERLAQDRGSKTVCSLPFRVNGKWTGVVTLESSNVDKFTKQDIDFCEGVALLTGPILETSRMQEQWIGWKLLDSFKSQVKKITGPDFMFRKLVSAFLLLMALFFTFATGDYRVTADAALEGSIQRSIVAPFNGYIAEANVRAGDIVKKDKILAMLDDRDLYLEHKKLASQLAQLLSQFRQARAEGERSNIKILGAQLGQTKAHLKLINEKKQKKKIRAPFSGVVVSGDLSQDLSAPVERGQVLFEVAPLDDFRIILQVDDRDISEVEINQSGLLTLSSLPEETFPFVVKKITPVAVSEEGRNYFRVEAELRESSKRFRPGMEGVSKIVIGERKLIWIWTHNMFNWLRMWAWSWLP